MFELGFSEMLLTGIVALVVLGPERLPKVARAAGLWLGRLQRFVSGVKNELSRQMDAEGLSEVKEDFQAAVREAQEGLRDARDALRGQTEDIDPELPAWERLPPQRTPADFGIGTDDGLHAGGTRYDDAVPSIWLPCAVRQWAAAAICARAFIRGRNSASAAKAV